MLNQHFYHQITRKYITHFGSIFDNITLVRYNKTHTSEIERIKVPVIQSNKESYLFALKQDPEKNRPINVVLPSMSFELTSIKYDRERQKNPLTRHNKKYNGIASYAQYRAVPYDLNFTLSIYARNTDDAHQIVEQILPIFQPEFNITVNFQTELGIIRDIPIILNDISQSEQFATDFSKTHFSIWELTFTMKGEYYGPLNTAKIIRTAYANTYLDQSLSTGYIIRMNMTNGNNGDYQLEDVVYQGNSPNEATAAGIVIQWFREANTSLLRLGGVQGLFTTNATVHATSTNASYTLASIDVSPLKIVSQKVTPNPLTANIGDDFGYTETLIEFPDLE